MSNHIESPETAGIALKKQWHLWFMMLSPILLLGILIFVFAGIGIQTGQIDPDQVSGYIEARLPYILALNHTTVFLILIYLLRKNDLGMRHIGWKIPAEKFLMEILIGLACGVALYLFKELVFDSIMALVEGNNPTFTSLFNFSLETGELPMMIVATCFVFIEESIFRGFAIKALDYKYGIYKAVIISSIFFGFLHWGNGMVAILYTAVMGIFFAGIYLWRGRNLIPVTIAHALYNFMILLT